MKVRIQDNIQESDKKGRGNVGPFFRFQRTSSAYSVAIASLGLGACASAPLQQSSSTPDASAKCVSPTVGTTLVVLSSAMVGHTLDKRTGGGRGFETLLGISADQIAHGCRGKTESDSLSAPAPAPAPAPNPVLSR